MMTLEEYLGRRRKLLEDGGDSIIATERLYAERFHSLIVKSLDVLKQDFDLSSSFYPFWANYPPAQRGRQPVGDSVPWIEVGETSLVSNVIRLVSLGGTFGKIQFPGLPSGGDLRFLSADAFVHFDIKVTGPRDNPNEVVASRNQMSGTGHSWNDKGFLNSDVTIVSPRASQLFHPELPPFYVLDDGVKLCLTFFLKAVYEIEEPGTQPLEHLELVCVPNGLLLFDGPKYAEGYPDLMRPGKDDATVPYAHRRRRVKLDPLSRIDAWRSIRYTFQGEPRVWAATMRANGLPPRFD